MKYIKFVRLWALISVCGASGGVATAAATLADIRADGQLNPNRFAAYFADFQFDLQEQVQAPDAFLASKKGDCDDYAILAADVLREKGFTTKLVVVFMPKDIHVVCYIAETKSYLDFNVRAETSPTVPSDGSLEDIADKVARSFQSSWHCVSEFTFQNGMRRIVKVDFPSGKPAAPVAVVPPPAPTAGIASAQ